MDIPRLIDEQLGLLCEEGNAAIRGSRAVQLHGSATLLRGKLLRPRVALLSTLHGAALGGDVNWAVSRTAALAIEFAHIGTLYHDDLVDCSTRRRGAPAVYRRVGPRGAALGGGHLLAMANAMAAQLPDDLARAWGIAALRVSDGQLRETENAGNLDLPIESYLKIARKKTASLFELAALVGSHTGGCRDTVALTHFGRHLGTAFQLFDDLRDFEQPSPSHRPPGNDLRERIYTLPVLLACREDGDVASTLRDLLRDDGRPVSPSARVEILDLLRQSGAFDRAAEFASAELELAMATIESLPDSPAKPALRQIGSALSRLESGSNP